MSDHKKSSSGSSQAERKAFRDLDAREAMAEYDRAQTAFHDNHERLRSERLVRFERLAREAADPAGGKLVVPTPQLPDDTPIDKLQLTTRIREALHAGGLRTVGEIRDKSDQQLLSIRDLGSGSVAHLRASLSVTPVRAVRQAENSDA
jgi:DNA-directed RNA polymerase alpha subunit